MIDMRPARAGCKLPVIQRKRSLDETWFVIMLAMSLVVQLSEIGIYFIISPEAEKGMHAHLHHQMCMQYISC